MVPTVLVAPVPPGGLNEASTVAHVLHSSSVFGICVILYVTQMILMAYDGFLNLSYVFCGQK
jgi:hypothetical protein